MNIDFEQFKTLAKTYNIIPLFDTFSADLDTPVTALLKLKTDDYDFLFESVVGGEKWARYSFLGTNPKKVFRLDAGTMFELDVSTQKEIKRTFKNSPLEVLREEFKNFNAYQDPNLPRFFGGIVGYFGYDLVSHFDNISLTNPKKQDIPDAYWILTDAVVIFDNLKQVMEVVATCHVSESDQADEQALEHIYNQACQKIKDIKSKLDQNTPRPKALEAKVASDPISSLSKEEFCDVVKKTKEYIEAGDIFQAVLSMRFDLKVPGIDPVQLYRSIRRINPSPYMYYLCLKGLAVVGASPEVLVRLEDGKVQVRPIAGTRPRGLTEAQDLELEQELINDPKERAEHVMLLDLGRNDAGRIAKIGTVKVDETEVIERYSHVMHLVSQVSAELADNKDVFDVIRAAFPAGTLSGAPKIRAMQIIEELEPCSRGIYGGAVGYISFTKNTDLAIAIRTALIKDDQVTIQAGAGLVYNSVPELEYQESCNKAKAMMKAVEDL